MKIDISNEKEKEDPSKIAGNIQADMENEEEKDNLVEDTEDQNNQAAIIRTFCAASNTDSNDDQDTVYGYTPIVDLFDEDLIIDGEDE